jgi:putative membrane protein
MMYWYGPGSSAWATGLMGLGMVVFWVLLAAGVVVLVRHLMPVERAAPSSTRARVTPEDTLAQRFAAGEIDEREYRQRLAVLRAQRPR